MVNLLVAENRNTDPVRFFGNRVKVFLGEDYTYSVWVEEDILFSCLSLDQKRLYLTTKRNKSLEYVLPAPDALKMVRSGFPTKNKSKILTLILNSNSNYEQ